MVRFARPLMRDDPRNDIDPLLPPVFHRGRRRLVGLRVPLRAIHRQRIDRIASRQNQWNRDREGNPDPHASTSFRRLTIVNPAAWATSPTIWQNA